ncbi:MAG: biopolymer transporter ExbD, partial [Phycisphaerales bacterium]|nr:biopolymer transporter ExbD [Phycisphaerales bacterium]
MGRFRDLSADDGGETGIDMSPLIDCVFILLIFFIVTTVFVE